MSQISSAATLAVRRWIFRSETTLRAPDWLKRKPRRCRLKIVISLLFLTNQKRLGVIICQLAYLFHQTGACSYRFTFDGRVMCLHAAFGVLFVGLNTGVVASIDLVVSDSRGSLLCLAFSHYCHTLLNNTSLLCFPQANKLLERLPCHEPRGVSCLTTATEGQRKLLCCGSFDSTITIRDYKVLYSVSTLPAFLQEGTRCF